MRGILTLALRGLALRAGGGGRAAQRLHDDEEHGAQLGEQRGEARACAQGVRAAAYAHHARWAQGKRLAPDVAVVIGGGVRAHAHRRAGHAARVQGRTRAAGGGFGSDGGPVLLRARAAAARAELQTGVEEEVVACVGSAMGLLIERATHG